MINFSQNYLNRGFWGDEAWTSLISQLPYLQMLKTTAADFHPPGYYSVVELVYKILPANEIGTRYFYGGNLLYQPAYEKIDYRISGNLTQTDKIFKDGFWVGIHPLINKGSMDYVASQFKKYVKKIDNSSKSAFKLVKDSLSI